MTKAPKVTMRVLVIKERIPYWGVEYALGFHTELPKKLFKPSSLMAGKPLMKRREKIPKRIRIAKRPFRKKNFSINISLSRRI